MTDAPPAPAHVQAITQDGRRVCAICRTTWPCLAAHQAAQDRARDRPARRVP